MTESNIPENVVESKEYKRCPKCGKKKTTDMFYGDKHASDALRSNCKKCCNDYNNTYNKEYRLKNKDRLHEQRKKYETKNRDKRNRKLRERWIADPVFKLNHVMSGTVRRGLTAGKEGKSWKDLVDFTVEELKHHLEKQFTDGMTWERFLNGKIHLDHKIPLAVFNFKTIHDIDFKHAWALDNLQPLWAIDNMRKSAKIEEQFQPSFAFGRALNKKNLTEAKSLCQE